MTDDDSTTALEEIPGSNEVRIDPYGAILHGGPSLQVLAGGQHDDVYRMVREKQGGDVIAIDAFRAEVERIRRSEDLSPQGRAKAIHEAAAKAFGHLERRVREADEYEQKHRETWAEELDLGRLTRVQGIPEDVVSYGRHVALDELRRAKREGDHAVEALLLRAARSGDQVLVGAVAGLPPTIRADLVPEGVLSEVAQELHAALHPERHERLRVLDLYWGHRRHTIATYQRWLTQQAGIHPAEL